MAQGGDRVRVLVADDHPLFRDGVARAVSAREDFELVGEAGDGKETLDMIRSLEPDVATVDLRMPSLDAIEVVEAAKAAGSPTKVLVLSAVEEEGLVYRAVAAGAAGYLSKEVERSAICDAIATVAAGGTVLSPTAQAALASQVQVTGAESRPVLSERELEILRLTADGRSMADIAEQLFISRATVKTHLQRAYEKLGVADRAAAVAEAMRRNLLD
jgi:two-component system nitrate/nitrite response regulator NarL